MRSQRLEFAVTLFSWISALVFLGIMTTLLTYLLVKGAPYLTLALIFGTTSPLDGLLLKQPVLNGLFPAIAGTLLLVFFSVLIALPAGLSAGIYLAEYAKGSVKGFFSLMFDLLAGIPSIVVGLFGFSVTIFLHQRFFGNLYPCLLISSVSLAFLVLPCLIRTTQTALESLPLSLRQTGLALGATPLQNLFRVLLPRSLSGIMTGVILAIGRCAEDTAVIMLTGVVVSSGIPKSVFSNYEALPFYIYYISSQYRDRAELGTGYGAALLLLGICGLLYFAAFFINRRFKNAFRKRV